MSAYDIINLISSIASLILSVVAIWLSLYFYTKGKKTELDVANALESIKTQTNTLQELTRGWINRLTKFVTEPRDNDPFVQQVMQMIREIPSSIAMISIRASGPDTSAQHEASAIVGTIAAHYYCALANVAVQSHLPALSQMEQDDGIRRLLDQSFNDFKILDNALTNTERRKLEASQLYHLYQTTIGSWKPLVKDAVGVFQNRQNPPQ